MQSPQKPDRLASLAALLRDQSQWPDGFSWYYGDCTHCAMTLAILALGAPDVDFSDADMWRWFDIDAGTAISIFYDLGQRAGYRSDDIARSITPEDVAAKIDERIAALDRIGGKPPIRLCDVPESVS